MKRGDAGDPCRNGGPTAARRCGFFFRAMKSVNTTTSEELETNAQTCELVADRVEIDPRGEAPKLVTELGGGS